MQVSYDPQDIQEIALRVAEQIAPLVQAEIRKAVAGQTPPAARPEPPIPGVPRGKAAGDMLSPREVREMTGLSETTMWRLRKAGQFPAPLRLSAGRIGWIRAEVEAWRESRR